MMENKIKECGILANKIAEHNAVVLQTERRIQQEMRVLEIEKKKGDELKFEEIQVFRKANNLKQVWFKQKEGFKTVYGGEPFEAMGISQVLKADGTEDGTVLLELLREKAEIKTEKKYVNWGRDDMQEVRIFIVTFE